MQNDKSLMYKEGCNSQGEYNIHFSYSGQTLPAEKSLWKAQKKNL